MSGRGYLQHWIMPDDAAERYGAPASYAETPAVPDATELGAAPVLYAYGALALAFALVAVVGWLRRDRRAE